MLYIHIYMYVHVVKLNIIHYYYYVQSKIVSDFHGGRSGSYFPATKGCGEQLRSAGTAR